MLERAIDVQDAGTLMFTEAHEVKQVVKILQVETGRVINRG